MRIRKNSNKNLINLFADEDFKNTFDSVQAFFELYLKEEDKLSELDYVRIQAAFRESKIQEPIRKLSKTIRKIDYILTTPFTKSLNTNIGDFIKMDTNSELEEWKGKWISLTHAYLSFIGSIKAIPAFQRFSESKVKGKKSILAISLLYEEQDNIKANEEIKQIFSFCEEEDSLFILPVYGCTFKVFLSLIELYNFDILHISGHGNQAKLKFVNDKIGNRRFINNVVGLEKKLELGFLNCCETFSFVNQQKLPFTDYTICYDGELSIYLGSYVAKCFYRHLVLNRQIPSAWKEVYQDVDEINMADYYFLT